MCKIAKIKFQLCCFHVAFLVHFFVSSVASVKMRNWETANSDITIIYLFISVWNQTHLENFPSSKYWFKITVFWITSTCMMKKAVVFKVIHCFIDIFHLRFGATVEHDSMIVLFLHSFLCYNDNSDRSQIRKTLLCLFIILNKQSFTFWFSMNLSLHSFICVHTCRWCLRWEFSGKQCWKFHSSPYMVMSTVKKRTLKIARTVFHQNTHRHTLGLLKTEIFMLLYNICEEGGRNSFWKLFNTVK